jgi:hypothetical protein
VAVAVIVAVDVGVKVFVGVGVSVLRKGIEGLLEPSNQKITNPAPTTTKRAATPIIIGALFAFSWRLR